MAIKIWHQSYASLASLPDYERVLREHLLRVTRSDTEVVLHGMSDDTYFTNYPGPDLTYSYVQTLHVHQFARAALAAQAQGFDAFALTTLPEPGLRQIRSLVSIPVVGFGESAMLAACQLGLKFGVLLFVEGMIPLIEHNVHELGLDSRCAGVRHAGFEFADVITAFDHPKAVVDRFFVAARRLIAEGADVIIPGEAPLNILLQRAGVSRVDDVPILDGVATTMMAAEMMVDLQKKLGISRCTRGYFQAPPPAGRLAELHELYGLTKFQP